MEIEARNVVLNDRDSGVKANVDLTIDKKLIVKGFSVREGENGLFVACPMERGSDGKYYQKTLFTDKESGEYVDSIILETYENCKEKGMNMIKGEYIEKRAQPPQRTHDRQLEQEITI